MSYASNVIVNFGSNASQLFKGMQKVKAEIKGVQAQAMAATKAVGATSAGFFGMAEGKISKKLEKSYWKGVTGMISGYLGYKAISHFLEPISEGFHEVTSSSKEFSNMLELLHQGLKSIGDTIGHAVIPAANGFSDAMAGVIGFLHGGAAKALFKAGYADIGNTGPFGEQFTTPVSEHEKWQREQNELAKKQAAYLRDTRDTLRRMENDLERMNTLDPW